MRETVGDMKLPKQKCFEIYVGPYCTYDDSLALFLSRAVSHICAPGFFYTMGGTAEKYAAMVQRAFPYANILDSGEVWKPFNGGASVARSSHWYVTFMFLS